MRDRRLSGRYELSLRIAVETASDDRNRVEETRLIDIGPGGACFGLKADLETGSIVAMTIPDIDDGFTRAIGLPSRGEGSLNIKLQGEVLRSEKVDAEAGERRVAVRFVGPVRLAFEPKSHAIDEPHHPNRRANSSEGTASENRTNSHRDE